MQFRDQASARPADVTCEYCACPVARLHPVEVPDSGYLHPTEPELDGRRLTHACCPEHGEELVAHGLRNWLDEQLWTAKLQRVSERWRNEPMSVEQFAELAGLTPAQLRRALRYRMEARSVPRYVDQTPHTARV
ncbi:hypothetical protein SAMN06265360_12127 [Haloechinothrix alba]|uniref:Uncharacterized protein n=1 Tax=Haloechinothrix alba TaxID=664784 RepID=A0A238ZH52_9PSEU|nr:hypothetical protein [Haloechinothrix alba]SNR82023.1 hypothetical protein SAMN06265360_12127 [Haloechinothrix alba]